MYTETIIKLIGHRPVYRVERNPASAFQAFEDQLGRPPYEVPVIDRKDWQRSPGLLGEWELPEACC